MCSPDPPRQRRDPSRARQPAERSDKRYSEQSIASGPGPVPNGERADVISVRVLLLALRTLRCVESVPSHGMESGMVRSGAVTRKRGLYVRDPSGSSARGLG